MYEEIDRIRDIIKEAIAKRSEKQPKFKLILEKVNDYSKQKISKNMISEVIKIQSLVEEIKNGTDA